ncbi:MAG: plastocyanin/azurin family copper-binding protein [Gemmatimonadaceae bacterium]
MKTMNNRHVIAALAICSALFVAACGNEAKTTGSGAPPAADAPPAASQVATGKTIVVELFSDAEGNYFKPAKIEAHRGDVVRFTLKSGVHNVHFLADSNPGAKGLPAASDMLQLPDQTFDVPVTFAKGRYFFQCDPHALLGMTGHLKVED